MGCGQGRDTKGIWKSYSPLYHLIGMRVKYSIRDEKTQLEELYHGCYFAFYESERLKRYGQNSKTQNRVHGYETDLETFYRSMGRWCANRESCCILVAEQML